MYTTKLHTEIQLIYLNLCRLALVSGMLQRIWYVRSVSENSVGITAAFCCSGVWAVKSLHHQKQALFKKKSFTME